MTILQEIERRIPALSLPEKGKLAHELLTAIDGEHQSYGEFEAEIQKRLEKIRSGQAVGVPATEVFAGIEAKLG